jgi:pyruvate dehydrogenase E2 component (dihydrolipoamide acetyltransferase)
MAIEINVPDIGADEVEITEILVKVGDKVEAEQSLITVEGDKASMEVPSPQAGVVKEIKVSVGDKTETGKLIMIFDSADGAADAAPAKAEEKKEAAPAAAPAAAAAKTFTCRTSAVTKLKSLRSWLKWATPLRLSSP